MAHWVHRCPQTPWNIFAKLGGSARCYYQLYEVFDLSVYQWCSGITLRNYLFLCRRRFILSSCHLLVVWWNVIRSPWFAHLCSWEGDLYHDITDQPWSYLMLATVGCRQQNNFHLVYCRSLDYSSGSGQDTGGTESEYPGKSPILFVGVNPDLQLRRRYFPLRGYLIFDMCFPLMNVLHVKWFLRRHQF